ncbi:MAG: T9SS type A sorting domain-containing protein [Flavobacteriales bacterium]|nr:T9SS type A sorting domain-containing protein [Flavobacteriales bacterium]
MVRGFCTALGTLVISGLSAQSDTIFPNVSGSWDMTTTTWDWDGMNMNFIYFQHHLEFDPGINEEENGFVWGAVLDNFVGQVGWLAVSDRRVYYRAVQDYYYGYGTYGDTTMRVLYDFDMVVGDTTYFDEGIFPATVQGIDSVQLAGRTRARFTLSNGDEWIMGMGSIQGLLRPFQYVFECIYSTDLFCGSYMQPDSVVYTTCLPDGIKEVMDPRFALFPNPCTGEFAIRSDPSEGRYRITDLRGVEVISGALRSKETLVRIPQASPGLYMVEVAGRFTKLIIQ